MTEDRIFVERAQSGDTAAFRKLVERYQQQVYYLALDMTGNQHDAEDLSQDVFIKAYRHLGKFRGDAKFSSWLYRITVNTSIDQTRKKSLKAMTLKENIEETGMPQHQTFGQDVSSPEDKAESGLMQQHIEKALQALTDKERSVFILRHYQHMKLGEIAEILKITVGTVKSTLFRALQRLQKELAFYKADLGMENTHE